MILTSPMIVLALIWVSWAGSWAWRRSMTTDPISANALWCSGTDQTPWRLHSPMIAVDEAWPTAGTPAAYDARARLPAAGARAGGGRR